MGPLVEKLPHHPAFRAIHGSVGRITTVPVRNSQATSGFEHAKQFVGVALFVGHMRACLDTPDGIKALVRELQVEGVHHREVTRQS